MNKPIRFKPYTHVLVKVVDPYVEQGRRQYVGEVMSFETPEHTLMVRRVPGHSGTLEEVSVQQLTPLPKRKRYVHYAEVSGWVKHCFPSDMLRYDSCVPMNFKLVPNQFDSPVAVVDEAFGFGKTLVVARCSDHRMPDFTEGRWYSFGCKIKPIRTEGEGYAQHYS